MANEFKIKKGLIVTGASGGTVVDIQGSQGQLFSVTDNLSGSIFAVSDISGVPIFDVNSSGLSTFDGPLTGTSATFSGDITLGDDLNFTTNGFADISNTGTGAMRFKPSSQTLALTLIGANATFAGNITMANAKILYTDDIRASTGPMAVGPTGEAALTLRTFSTTRLTIASDGDATFTEQAFSAATSSGDASSTLTTKGYVDGLITGATIYRGTWQAGISATSTGTTSSSTTLTVSAAILDAAGNTPTLVGAVVTGAGITGTVKVASVTSSTVYELDTAISATATAYIFSPIYGAPDLSGVTQTSGYYYICSEAGSATPNGAGTEPNTWGVGDWVIWNDDVGASGEWQKVDNSSVLSGVGTGQTVALWEGPSSVTDSETLGNAPITVSGNNTTFGGSVGIGSSPSDKLTVSGSGNFGIKIDNSSNTSSDYSAIRLIQDSAEKGVIYTNQEDLYLRSPSGDVLLQHSGGNVGIGTTSPDYKLQVGDNGVGDGNITMKANGVGANAGAKLTFNMNVGGGNADSYIAQIVPISYDSLSSGTHNSLNFKVGTWNNNADAGVSRMTILSNGNIGIGTTDPGTARLAVIGGNVGIGTTGPDSPLEVQFTEATGTAKQMLHIDYNSTNNYGSGYLKISAGTNSAAVTQIEQVTSGGNGLFGTYIDTNIINKGLSASAHGNINFVTGSSTSASSIVMTIGGGSQRGNVGIGTTSPNSKLNVYDATADTSINVNTGTGGSYPKKTGISFGATSTSLGGDAKFTGGAGIQALNTAASGNPTDLTFWTNSTGTPAERARITSTGHLQVSTGYFELTSQPTTKLWLSTNQVQLYAGNLLVFGGYNASNDSVVIGNESGDVNVTLAGGANDKVLYLEGSSGNVGIGTKTPLAKLDIQGTQGQLFSVTDDLSGSIFAVADISGVPIFDVNSSGVSYFDGDVGIGTTSPSSRLEVYGTDGLRTHFNEGLRVTRETVPTQYGMVNYNGGALNIIAVNTAGTGSVTKFMRSGNGTSLDTSMVIDTSGNVGIGTTSPLSKLTIDAPIGNFANGTNAISLNYDGGSSPGDVGGGIVFSQKWWSASTGQQVTGGIFGIKHAGNGSYGGGLGFYTQPNGASNMAQHMVIRSTGEVGIGTDAPLQKLSLFAGTNESVYDVLGVYNSVTGTTAQNKGAAIRIGKDIDGNYSTKIATIYESNNPSFLQPASAFYTMHNTYLKDSETEKMRISSNGNVGIGFTSPGSTPLSSMKLSVNGNGYFAGNVGIGTTSPGARLSLGNASGQQFYVYEGGNVRAGLGVDMSGSSRELSMFCTSSDGFSTGNISFGYRLESNGAYQERMRLTSGGNLGIGTTGPDEKLTVNGITRSVDQLFFGAINTDNITYGPYIESYDDKGLKFDFNGNTGGEFQIWNHDANGGGATEVFTIEDDNNIFMPSSNVTIGKTTSALGALDVDGTFIVSVGTQVRFRVFYTSNYTFVNGGTNGSTIYFGAPTSNVQNIRVQGTATATNFILSSDEILKDNIKNIDNKHIDVDWKNFELKSEPGVKRSGVIAQELEKKHPEFVRTDKEGLKSVAYIDLLIAKIAELEARLEKAGI